MPAIYPQTLSGGSVVALAPATVASNWADTLVVNDPDFAFSDEPPGGLPADRFIFISVAFRLFQPGTNIEVADNIAHNLRFSAVPAHWFESENFDPALTDRIVSGVLPEPSDPVAGGGTAQTIAAQGLVTVLGEEVFPIYATISATKPADNIRRLEIMLDDDNDEYNTTHQWVLIVRSEYDVRELTWAVAPASAAPSAPWSDSEQPWIHIPSNTVDVNGGLAVPPNSETDVAVPVTNYGPGSLEIPSGNLGAGSLGFSIAAPVTIPPASTGSIVVRFSAPAAASVVELNASVSGDPAAIALSTNAASEHNSELSMSATVGAVDLALVLDTSGSMRWSRDGLVKNPAIGERRWDDVTEAAASLANDYVNFLGDGVGSLDAGRLSVALFPGGAPDGILPGFDGSAPLTSSTASNLRSALEAITPTGNTPMGVGIGRAMGIGNDLGLFEDSSSSRWMVLMSDGEHNTGQDPEEYADGNDNPPDFFDKNVRLITVAYGLAGETEVDHARLEGLVTSTAAEEVAAEIPDGERSSAVVHGTGDVVSKFRTLLTKVLGVSELVDPWASLSPGASNTHEFTVSKLDDGLSAMVNWPGAAGGKLLQVSLASPLCEVFDEGALSRHEVLRLHGSRHLKSVFVPKAFVHGAIDGRTRYGTWKLIVRHLDAGNEGEAPSLDYNYSILCASRLRLGLSLAETSHETGQPLQFSAKLRLSGGLPVEGATVKLALTRPTSSYNNALAGTSVGPKQLEPVSELMAEVDPLAGWAVKAHAIKLMLGQDLVMPTLTTEVPMVETEPGVYRFEFEQTFLPGTYQALIVATGTADGESFRREATVQAQVVARPEPEATEIDYQFGLDGQLIAHVRLQDAYGNTVLAELGDRPEVSVEARGLPPSGEIQTNYDGWYTQAFPAATEPTQLVVRYDDEIVSEPEVIPVLEHMRWMEEVLFYRSAPKEDDAHSDPKVALGPVRGPTDPFVALGGAGMIMLSNECRRIRAERITVFTRPENRRSYLVEGLLPGRRNCPRWVTLGRSSGAISSFDVAGLGVRCLQAIRIVDTTGILPHDESDAAGVMLLGVGYTPSRGRDRRRRRRRRRRRWLRRLNEFVADAVDRTRRDD